MYHKQFAALAQAAGSHFSK